MSRLISITAIFLLLHTVHSIAATENSAMQLQKGNSYYIQQQYDSAAYYLEQVAALKPLDARVYYNLGNAYYRLNKVPSAILNYQRALVIDPEYKTAKDNLLLAQSRINNAIAAEENIFFITWWHAVTRPDRANGLAVTSLILFVIFILLLLWNRAKKKDGRPLPPQLSGFVFFTFLCLMALSFAAAKNATSHESGVVMQADAPLMHADLKGKPIILIPEGTTVKIEEEKNDWAQVRLPDGRSGWIQLSTITKI